MDKRGGSAPGRRGRGDRDADRRPALAGAAASCATAARPGHAATRAELARGGRREPTASPTNRATCTCASRSAAAGSYAYLCAGDFDGFDRALDEVLELAGDDRRAGAGIVIGSPVAWATMAQGAGAARARPARGGRSAVQRRRCGSPTEEGDPEIASWTRSNQALMLAMRGDLEAAIALARRNCELTERLGDVFSRSLALSNLGGAQIAAGDYAGALETLEEAERVYRDAVSDGDEMETWRAGLRVRGADRRRPRRGGAGAGGMGDRGRPRARHALVAAARPAGGRRSPAPRPAATAPSEALDEAAEVARETGAMISLEAVETTRATLGARASRRSLRSPWRERRSGPSRRSGSSRDSSAWPRASAPTR